MPRPSTAEHVVLRAGTPADAAGLRALGEAVVPATYDAIDRAYAAMMLERWWSTERLGASLASIPHVVADAGGAVVGVANLGRREDREVVWKLYVHPAHQGRGLGTRLLDEVTARVEGDAVWLEVVDGNEPAAAFYRAHGFAEVERVAVPPWPDDVWMRKDLR